MSEANGWRTFVVVWLGQVVSMFGSGLTAFAMGVWVYQSTGSVTLFTLIALSATLPGILLAPIAGALVDRWDRRWTMILADTGAALATGILVVLLVADRLAVWHVYFVVALISLAGTFQNPAFGASIPLLVPRKQLGRVGGMMEFGISASEILAPLLAGVLLVRIQVAGVIAVDLATFLFAALLLLFVSIPRPPRSEAAQAVQGSLLREAGYGWRYIRERPGLLTLLLYFTAMNFLVPMAMVLSTPLVLGFAEADGLGLALAIGSAGAVVGSLVMSAWGGPQRRIYGILGMAPVLVAGLLIAGLRPSVFLVGAGLFLIFFAIPITNASSQAIWQTKVAPDVQGRVFAMRRMIAQISAPAAFLIAGPLAEKVFQPLLAPGGALAASLGTMLGTGPTRGIGLLFITMAALFALVALFAFSFPRLRRLEDEVPDAIPDVPAPPPPEPSPAAGAPGTELAGEIPREV